MKKKWTKNDDLVCCEEYVKKYIIYKDKEDANTLVYNLKLKLNNKFEEASIRKKLSNTKHLLCQMNILHYSDISPLNHFSEQNLVALCEILIKHNIHFDINLDKLITILSSKR